MQTLAHVIERDGTYYIRDKRVPLISIITLWNNGESPETIQEHFPVLELAEIYGGITYYLDNRTELDMHFAQVREDEVRVVDDLAAKNQALHATIRQRFVDQQRRETSHS